RGRRGAAEGGAGGAAGSPPGREMTAAADSYSLRRTSGGVAWTFLAIVRRDLAVLVRDAPSVVIQTAMQPLFLAFVLGRVLPELGLARPTFAEVLLPGVVALAV